MAHRTFLLPPSTTVELVCRLECSYHTLGHAVDFRGGHTDYSHQEIDNFAPSLHFLLELGSIRIQARPGTTSDSQGSSTINLVLVSIWVSTQPPRRSPKPPTTLLVQAKNSTTEAKIPPSPGVPESQWSFQNIKKKPRPHLRSIVYVDDAARGAKHQCRLFIAAAVLHSAPRFTSMICNLTIPVPVVLRLITQNEYLFCETLIYYYYYCGCGASLSRRL